MRKEMQEAADRLAAEEESNFSKGRNMITRLMAELEKEPATEVRFHPFEKLSAADAGSGLPNSSVRNSSTQHSTCLF